MNRIVRVLLALLAAGALITASGCKEQLVTVRTGEIVLCTEGEIASDTTEQLEVPADEVGRHKVTTRVETCDLHAKLALLYRDAQSAIVAGDFDAAAKSLSAVVKLDPTYRRAGRQLVDVEAGRTPPIDRAADSGSGGFGGSGGNGSSGGSGGSGDDEVPTGPVMNLAIYVPDTLPGFNGQGLVADPFVLTRQYVPTSQGAISSLVIVVEQFKDTAAAKVAMDSSLKSSYPTSGRSLTVEGKPGYFGANRSVAIAAFVDGAVLVAVEGVAASGKGSDLRSALTLLAGAVAP